MYRVFLGRVSALSACPLPAALKAQAPQGSRRNTWLAGRVLLSRALIPLPEIVCTEHGKPIFAEETSLWFSLSHSGDSIALLLSDEGEVGCDIETIRPRRNWPALADLIFTPAEHAEIAAELAPRQLETFWRIWTRKEAIIKQRGESVWQLAGVDSTRPGTSLFVSHTQIDSLSLAVCTPTPFILEADVVQRL